jgi:hypothetical protein
VAAPNPDCKTCGGTGSVEAEGIAPHPPAFHRCECALRKDILENVERAFHGLSTEAVIPSSPLIGRVGENLLVQAGNEFRAHLRHVLVRQPITYRVLVASDAELMTAWLASIALAGMDILDPDAYTVSIQYLTLTDLATPPDLLVVHMGVKVARNVAASEVLAETINMRLHEGKPTWIWDDPVAPLNAGHLFWSVGRLLRRFDVVKELSVAGPRKGGRAKAPDLGTPATPPAQGRKTLRGNG